MFSFILYPSSFAIFLNSSSSFGISGSSLNINALYFLAISFALSVNFFSVSLSCSSHTKPLGAYIIYLLKIGTFLKSTLIVPFISPSSSTTIISCFQSDFTFAHSGDCKKCDFLFFSKNSFNFLFSSICAILLLLIYEKSISLI